VAAEVAGGDSISLAELAHQHGTAITTVFRWTTKGLPDGRGGRVVLEAFRRGRKWLTSSAAVVRFFAALPQSTLTPAAPPIRTPTNRERASKRAEKVLTEEYGF
jgi:hypothetical protein